MELKVELSDKVLEKLEAEAKSQGITRDQLVDKCIEVYLNDPRKFAGDISMLWKKLADEHYTINQHEEEIANIKAELALLRNQMNSK